MAGLQGTDAINQGLAESAHDRVLLDEKRDEKLDDAHISEGKYDQLDRRTTNATVDSFDETHETPSEEDKVTLRRVSGPISFSAYLVGFVELCERFSYYGSTVVFQNFIQRTLPPNSRTGAVIGDKTAGQAGALGLGQRTATALTTFNTFWVYCTPLAGGYVADKYLGRYNTILVSIAIALVGHVLLVVSAIPTVISDPNGALACFVIAIIIMGAGTGGFKPNISPLIAEQIERKQKHAFVETRKGGERVIVDPNVTVTRVYNAFYFCVNVGALIGQIGMSYSAKYVGFWLAYLLPTIMFSITPFVMILGKKLYVQRPPGGSVLGDSMKLVWFGMKGRWSLNPLRLYRNAASSDFWESVKPSNIPADKRPAWMTMDDQWVDEVRRGFKACKIFTFYPLWWLTYNQMNNNLVSQAATMETHGLPNDVLSNLDPFALLILIPIFDIIVYPSLRRYGILFTPVKRIFAGFITGAVAMMCAAIVQHYIYKTSECGYYAGGEDCTPAPLNVWIQTPSYVLIAMSEIFASITGLEVAFTMAPKNMRSLVTAVFLFQSALAAALGEAFVALSEDPNLVWNYGVMGTLSFGAGIVFWFCFRNLDKEHVKLVEMPEGHINAAQTQRSETEKQAL